MNNIPKNLHDAFKNKKLIPIVGAGVSMSLRKKNGDKLFPSWSKLLELAAKRAESEGKETHAQGILALLKLKKFQDAADLAKESLPGSLWNLFFKDIFSVKSSDIDEASLTLPKAIWTLGDRVITLNYDSVMRFASPYPQDVIELDNTTKNELADFKRNGNSAPAIWHLHGRVNNLEKIIFTSDRYCRLYLEKDSDYQAALETFRALCSSAQLLFVGCSLDDAELLQQLGREHNIFAGNTGPHYALIHKDQYDEIKLKLKDLSIELICFSDFGQPLLDQIAAISNGTSLRLLHCEADLSSPESLPVRSNYNQEYTRASALGHHNGVSPRNLALTSSSQAAALRFIRMLIFPFLPIGTGRTKFSTIFFSNDRFSGA